MALLTVEQAAKRLNRTVRSVNRWIEKKELEVSPVRSSTHPNKHFIEESEVERKAQELAQFELPGSSSSEQKQEDTRSLLDRVNQLEQELRDYRLSTSQGATVDLSDIAHVESKLERLEQRIAALESLISEMTRAQAPAAATSSTSKPRPTATTEALPADILPEGSILDIYFAGRHGVPESTVKGQVKSAVIPSIPVAKEKRPGQYSYWLSPEHQRAAIVFWTHSEKSQGVYHSCDVPGCPCQDTSELPNNLPTIGLRSELEQVQEQVDS